MQTQLSDQGTSRRRVDMSDTKLLRAFAKEVGRACWVEADDDPRCLPYRITVWVEPISVDGCANYGIGTTVAEAIKDARWNVAFEASLGA